MSNSRAWRRRPRAARSAPPAPRGRLRRGRSRSRRARPPGHHHRVALGDLADSAPQGTLERGVEGQPGRDRQGDGRLGRTRPEAEVHVPGRHPRRGPVGEVPDLHVGERHGGIQRLEARRARLLVGAPREPLGEGLGEHADALVGRVQRAVALQQLPVAPGGRLLPGQGRPGRTRAVTAGPGAHGRAGQGADLDPPRRVRGDQPEQADLTGGAEAGVHQGSHVGGQVEDRLPRDHRRAVSHPTPRPIPGRLWQAWAVRRRGGRPRSAAPAAPGCARSCQSSATRAGPR